MLGLFAACFGAAVSAAPDEPGASSLQGWLQVEPAGRGQAFTAFVRSTAPFDGRYELVSERSGPTGRSANRQAGSVRALPGEAVQLSRTALSPLGDDDRYSVILSIYDGDRLVARDERGR